MPINFFNLVGSILYVALVVMIFVKKRNVCLVGILAALAILNLVDLMLFRCVSSIMQSVALVMLVLCWGVLCLYLTLDIELLKLGSLNRDRVVLLYKIFYIIFGVASVMAMIVCFRILWTYVDNNLRLILIVGNQTFTSIWQAIALILQQIAWLLSVAMLKNWIIPEANKEKISKENANIDDAYISLGKHICLLLFTFGIWQMIWIHKTTKITNASKRGEYRNPTTKLLLCLFVPFYMIYWTYITAQRIDEIAKDNDVQSDIGTICLVLAIFVGIVPPILMQDKINKISSGEKDIQKNELDAVESIEKYKDLLDKGIITQEEFDAKKKQLLGL